MSGMASPFRQAGAERVDPLLVALWIALIIVAMVWIAPFVFIIFTSLKSNATVMGTGAFSPPTSLAWGMEPAGHKTLESCARKYPGS